MQVTAHPAVLCCLPCAGAIQLFRLGGCLGLVCAWRVKPELLLQSFPVLMQRFCLVGHAPVRLPILQWLAAPVRPCSITLQYCQLCGPATTYFCFLWDGLTTASRGKSKLDNVSCCCMLIQVPAGPAVLHCWPCSGTTTLSGLSQMSCHAVAAAVAALAAAKQPG